MADGGDIVSCGFVVVRDVWDSRVSRDAQLDDLHILVSDQS
jgi:hypothetical protein